MMIKIKDRIMLAGVASVIAQGAIRLSFLAQKHLGDEIKYDTIIASFFLTPSKAKTPTGTLVGLVGNLINGAVLATMTTYLLGATGRDKAILKGMGVGATQWVVVNGVFMGTQRQRKTSKPLDPLFRLWDHLLFGGVCGASIAMLGKDNLFPDSARVEGHLPLVYTGTK